MPCSVTRPVAAADPAAILDDAKASRSRSAVLDVDRRTGPGGMQRTDLVIPHVEKPQ
jgi:hypothetical protein